MNNTEHEILEDVELSDIRTSHDSSQRNDSDNVESVDIEVKSTIAGASFNFINSIVGAGIIGLAFAIKEAGFVMGIIMLILAASLTDYTVLMITGLGIKYKKRTYEDLCEFAIGQRGYQTVTTMMFLFAYGAMVAYLIIIGDTVPLVLQSWGADGLWVNREWVIIMFAIFFILPLALLRNMASLQFTSGMSLVAVIVLVCIVLMRAPVAAREQKIPIEDDSFAFVKPNLFAGLGAMSFAFVCHHSTFIVYDSLERPTWARWSKTTHISVGTALSVSALLSLGGYLSFFERTQGDILNNFSEDDQAVNVARVLLASTMIFTYPMEHFVARHCVHSVWRRGHVMSSFAHLVITAVLFTSSVGIALVVHDLGVVLELTGALSASILAYILPVLCYFRLSNASIPEMFKQSLVAWRWDARHADTNVPLTFYERLTLSNRFFLPMAVGIFGAVALVAGTIQALLNVE